MCYKLYFHRNYSLLLYDAILIQNISHFVSHHYKCINFETSHNIETWFIMEERGKKKKKRKPRAYLGKKS